MLPKIIRLITFIALAYTFLFLCSSCCTKKKCTFEAEDINEIQMINFAATDLDSIIVESFLNAIKEDSIFTKAISNPAGESRVTMPSRLNKQRNYRVTILSSGKIFIVSEFLTKKGSCNCNGDIEILDSYKVNGQIQKNLSLKITNP